MEEYVESAPEKHFDLPLRTKAGMVALPWLPTLGIDLLAHGGATPIALSAFGLVCLAVNSPKICEKLGNNEQFLLMLENHPDWLGRLDRASDGFFSRQLEKLRQSSVYRSAVAFKDRLQPKDEIATLPEMEALRAIQIVPEEDSTTRLSIIGADPQRRLNLAQNFQPDAQELLSTGVVAFGIPGSGKTTVIVRFLEQYIKRYRLPLVAFDSQGDLLSLVDICPRGIVATPSTLPAMSDVLRYGLQVVVNLQEWRESGNPAMSYELAARQIADSVLDLMAAQKTIDPRDRIPCLVAIDEIHLWTPQSGKPSYLESQTAGNVLTAMIALSTTGRKLGTIPFLATQRIAKVNKDVIGGMETRLFGKASLDIDIKRYREYFEGVVSDTEIKQFASGEMVVTMSGQNLHVQFFNRETRHVSHTPHLSQALDRFSGDFTPESIVPATPSVKSLETMTRRRGPSSYEEHQRRRRVLKERIVEAEAISARVREANTQPSEEGLHDDERAVLEAYRAGSKSGMAIKAATGIAGTRVNECLHRLAGLGLIDWQPRQR